jgi:hypothetical protein
MLNLRFNKNSQSIPITFYILQSEEFGLDELLLADFHFTPVRTVAPAIK